MGLRGPKGRNRNLPWPPGKKVYSPARGSSSPVSRWRLLVQYKHGVQCRTPRGAIVSMGLRGPKGRNRNLPWPPGKKVYSPARGSSSPVSRWRLLVQYKHGVQCRTPRGAIVSMGLRGPKGRNRNLPWPPGKKSYKDAYLLFALLPQKIRLKRISSSL